MEDDVQNVEADGMQASRQEVVQPEERNTETMYGWTKEFVSDRRITDQQVI